MIHDDDHTDWLSYVKLMMMMIIIIIIIYYYYYYILLLLLLLLLFIIIIIIMFVPLSLQTYPALRIMSEVLQRLLGIIEVGMYATACNHWRMMMFLLKRNWLGIVM